MDVNIHRWDKAEGERWSVPTSLRDGGGLQTAQKAEGKTALARFTFLHLDAFICVCLLTKGKIEVNRRSE